MAQAPGPTDTTSALIHRVERLERANRVLLAVMVLGGGLLLSAFVLGPPEVHDQLQTRQLQIVDTDGHVRMDLTHDSTGTRLFVHDDAGDVRVGVAQFAHGGGGFALHGPGGKGAAVLYLKGEGNLSFYDSAGALSARFPAP